MDLAFIFLIVKDWYVKYREHHEQTAIILEILVLALLTGMILIATSTILK